MKKLVQFFVLSFGIFVLTGCSLDDKNDHIVYYYDEPAVIESLSTNSVVRSAHDRFFVSSLENTSLKEGDLLWTYFTVDLNEKPNPSSSVNYRQATGFRYEIVDSAKAIIPAGQAEFDSYMSDDYTAFIHEALLYRDYLDKLLFFGFRRSSSSDDLVFDYEMIMEPNMTKTGKSYPMLCIRSKKVESQEKKSANETVFAFDMTDYISYYRKNISESGPVRFNLKYKTGTDEDGKDVYREFRSNPFTWEIK